MLRSGQGLTLLAQLGQLETVLGARELLESHLWHPIDQARL